MHYTIHLLQPDFLASVGIPTLSQVPPGPNKGEALPVTAAFPAHACGGRRAAEEQVLTAFSHVAPEMFFRPVTQASTRVQRLLPSASSLPLLQ